MVSTTLLVEESWSQTIVFFLVRHSLKLWNCLGVVSATLPDYNLGMIADHHHHWVLSSIVWIFFFRYGWCGDRRCHHALDDVTAFWWSNWQSACRYHVHLMCLVLREHLTLVVSECEQYRSRWDSKDQARTSLHGGLFGSMFFSSFDFLACCEGTHVPGVPGLRPELQAICLNGSCL